MPGALQPGMATPPAPDQGAGSPLAAGVLQSPQMPQAPTGAPGQQQQQPPQPPPAPTHAQTVAALRHFTAISKQLEDALKDPDLGKSDIKSKVIDGMTTLVANRIIPPGAAVTQLATFPEKPFDQRKWLLTHLQQVAQARDAVLGHHAMAFAGAGPEPTPHGDNHMQDISGMMAAHYAGGR